MECWRHAFWLFHNRFDLFLMRFVPNLLWTKHRPKDYDKYARNENKVLLLERSGEVLVSGLVLIFRNLDPQGGTCGCSG